MKTYYKERISTPYKLAELKGASSILDAEQQVNQNEKYSQSQREIKQIENVAQMLSSVRLPKKGEEGANTVEEYKDLVLKKFDAVVAIARHDEKYKEQMDADASISKMRNAIEQIITSNEIPNQQLFLFVFIEAAARGEMKINPGKLAPKKEELWKEDFNKTVISLIRGICTNKDAREQIISSSYTRVREEGILAAKTELENLGKKWVAASIGQTSKKTELLLVICGKDEELMQDPDLMSVVQYRSEQARKSGGGLIVVPLGEYVDLLKEFPMELPEEVTQASFLYHSGSRYVEWLPIAERFLDEHKFEEFYTAAKEFDIWQKEVRTIEEKKLENPNDTSPIPRAPNRPDMTWLIHIGKVVGDSLPYVQRVVMRGCGQVVEREERKLASHSTQEPQRFFKHDTKPLLRQKTVDIKQKVDPQMLLADPAKSIVQGLTDSLIGEKESELKIKAYVGPYKGGITGAQLYESEEMAAKQTIPKAVEFSISRSDTPDSSPSPK